MAKHSIDVVADTFFSFFNITLENAVKVSWIISVNVLKNMIDVRDCVKKCAILNMDDVMYIINDICLN